MGPFHESWGGTLHVCPQPAHISEPICSFNIPGSDRKRPRWDYQPTLEGRQACQKTGHNVQESEGRACRLVPPGPAAFLPRGLQTEHRCANSVKNGIQKMQLSNQCWVSMLTMFFPGAMKAARVNFSHKTRETEDAPLQGTTTFGSPRCSWIAAPGNPGQPQRSWGRRPLRRFSPRTSGNRSVTGPCPPFASLKV